MFRCGQCQENVGPGVPQVLVTVEIRKREYQNDVPDPNRDEATMRKVSQGWEIVKEIRLCPACRIERPA